MSSTLNGSEHELLLDKQGTVQGVNLYTPWRSMSTDQTKDTSLLHISVLATVHLGDTGQSLEMTTAYRDPRDRRSFLQR